MFTCLCPHCPVCKTTSIVQCACGEYTKNTGKKPTETYDVIFESLKAITRFVPYVLHFAPCWQIMSVSQMIARVDNPHSPVLQFQWPLVRKHEDHETTSAHTQRTPAFNRELQKNDNRKLSEPAKETGGHGFPCQYFSHFVTIEEQHVRGLKLRRIVGGIFQVNPHEKRTSKMLRETLYTILYLNAFPRNRWKKNCSTASVVSLAELQKLRAKDPVQTGN